MPFLKELCKGMLTEKDISLLPSSFDVVGDILIFADFPKALKRKEKKIGEKILSSLNNVKVVCKKTKLYGGRYRTPKLSILAGEKRKETLHKENSIIIKLDVEKVYFSPRLSHERERINREVKAGESVLVMFSGCGVYPVNIAKNSKAKEVTGVEINPVAHKYALDNIQLNKSKNVTLLKGDVKKVLPKMGKTFDRILMPLPKTAEQYLSLALKHLRKSGILHFYDFQPEGEFEKAGEIVASACKKAKRKCSIIRIVKCGHYAPGKFRVCVDARIS